MGWILPSGWSLNLYVQFCMSIASSLESSWVPHEASTSSPSNRAFGRFRALRALSRGTLGSSQALPSPLPPPASPTSPPSSSAPPPRPLSAALAGSQARVSRQGRVAAAGGVQGAGRRSPHLGEVPRPALFLGPAGRGPGPARRGAGRAAWPLPSLPSLKLRSPQGRTVL